MSKTIDERVVEMRFDNKHFESNVATTMSSLDKLKQSLNLKGATQGLEDIDRASKKVDLSPIADSADAIKLKFSPLYSFMDQIFRNMANSAEMYGRRIVSAFTIDPIKQGFKEYETQINAVQTILSNTKSKGTTIDDVNGALDELNTYADKTIYNFTEMTRNIGTFTAAGVDLETSVSAIKGIANLAAVSGSTSQQASTAMYQLSQALSSGTVKLMDWNSVVNAGMGGQKFQDALKETARLHGVKIDEMIKEQGSFRETLSEGWLTSKILTETLAKFTGDLNEEQLKSMGYTDEQIEGIIELGRDANDAATKVKTFTQLLDTLKEAAQSGWAQTWEIVFGEFYEARDFFTEVSDTLGGLIGNSAEARNEMLENWKALGGRQDLIDSLKNSFEAITNIIRPISDAFREIFPPMTAEKLSAFTSGLKTLTERFKESTEYGSVFYKGVKNTFKGIFSVFKIFVNVIKSVFKAIGPLFGVIGELAVAIFDLVGSFGGFLTRIGNTAEQTDILTAVLQGIVKVITFVITTFTNLIKLLNGRIVSPTLEAFGDIFVNIGDSADGMGEKIKGAFAKVGEALSGFGLFKVLAGIWEIIKNIAKGIGSVLGPVFSGLFEAIKNADLAGIMDIVNKFISGGVGIALINFLKNIGAIFKKEKGISDLVKNVGDIFDEVGNTFKSFQRKLNAEALFTIAKAIAVLVIAIAVLSFIDKEKVADACSAILILFASLATTMAIVNKGGFGTSIGGMASVTGIAAAVLILAGAMLMLCWIDNKKLAKGIVAVGSLLLLVTGVIALLALIGKINNGAIVKGTSKMMGIAITIGILAIILKSLAKLETSELVKGFIGISALMLLVTGVVAMLALIGKINNNRIVKSTAALFGLTIVIGALSLILKDLSKLSMAELGRGILGVSALALLMTGVTALLMVIAKINPSGKPFAKMVGQMAAIVYAIKVLADILVDLSGLSIEELGRGILGVSSMTVLLAGMMLLLSMITKVPNADSFGIVKMAVSMIAIAFAMKLLVKAIMPFTTMSWEAFAKAGVALGGLTVFMGILSLMTRVVNPVNLLVMALSITALSVGMLALVAAIAPFMALNWATIEKAGTALGGLLVFMAAISVMSKVVNPVQIAMFAASMLILSVALGALVPALLLMKLVGLNEIGLGLIVFAGALIVLGIAAKLLGGVSATMLSFAASVLMVGAGMSLIALGIGLLGPALAAFSVGFTAFVGAILVGAKGLIKILEILIVGIGDLLVALCDVVTDIIVALCDVIVRSAPAIGKAVNALLIMCIDVLIDGVVPLVDALLILITEILVALVKYADPILTALFDFIILILRKLADYIPDIIAVAADIIGAIFKGVIDALKNMNPGVLLGGILAIIAIKLLMKELSSIATMVPKALIGAAGVSAVLLIFAGALALCDLIYDPDGKTIAALAGAVVLMGLVSLLLVPLSAVSALVAPALLGAAGVALVIVEIAALIAAIGALAQIPGLTWLINEGGEMLKLIGNAIGGFVGGIIGGIAEGITSALPQIGLDLAAFMTNAKPFFDGLTNINTEAIDSVSSLAKMVLILTAADILDGITSWITGGSSIVTFGEELAQFGPKFAFFADSIKDVNADTVTASANAALSLAEMANKLPGQDGLWQKIAGEHSLTTFATELQSFGPAFAAYAKSVEGINPEVVTASANAALSLAEMAAKLPAQDGLAQWFAGDHSLTTFAEQLNAFAPSFKSYADTIKDIDPAVVTASASAATALAELANKLPKSGGMAQWFSGDQDIADFGNKLVEFGEQMTKYSDSISSINADKLASTTSSLVQIVNVAQGISSLNLDNLSGFGESLGTMALTGITRFITAFEGSYEKVVEAGKAMITKLVSGMQSESEAKSSSYQAPAKDAVAALRAKTVMEAFYNAGANLVSGFANGISDNSYKAEAKAAAMASAAANAAKKALDEHSPSKVGYKIGDFFGIAFVNAVGDYVDKSYDAGYGMADSARSGLSNAISKVNSLIGSDMETQPTIRPVLDLSDVNDGARTISDLFNNGSPLGLMTNIGAVSSMMSKNGQNGVESEVVSEIKKLRKDIGKIEHSTVSINGITYDDGSNINSAIESIVRAAKVERRR